MDWPPYPTALRLYAIAAERWAEIEAHYLAVDLLRLPAAKFLNAVYAWCVVQMQPDDREKWEIMLSAPIPGTESRVRPSEVTAEAEGAAFLSAMSAHRNLVGKG